MKEERFAELEAALAAKDAEIERLNQYTTGALGMADKFLLRAEAAEIAYREEHRRAMEAERLMRGLVEFARSLIGCSGRGAEYDDDGEKFTEEEQANVDQLHRRYCTRCRAAALLAEIEKEPVSPSEGR